MGTLPQAWSAVTDFTAEFEHLSEDSAVLSAGGGDGTTLLGFSGLCGGWVDRPAAGPFHPLGTPAHASVLSDSGLDVHAFSPMKADWATLVGVGSAPQVGDCVAIAGVDSGDAWAWSSRWITCVAVPPTDPLHFHTFYAAGSVVARSSGPTGAAVDRIECFDERSNSWGPIVPLYGAAPASLSTARNATLVDDGTILQGFSAERADQLYSPGGPGGVSSGSFVLPAGVGCVRAWAQSGERLPMVLLGDEPEPLSIF